MTTAILLSQGDELLTGQTVDTNSAWLSERLFPLGVRVIRGLTVGDDRQEIVDAVDAACAAADVVICTGGLGPTTDDLTAEAVAEAMGVELALDEAELAHIEALFARVKRRMGPANRKQALLPIGARPLRNDWGTAPGFQIEHRGARAYFLPGVPREMRQFWRHHLEPELRSTFDLTPPRRFIFRCMGIPESKLSEKLEPLAAPGITVSFRAMIPENQVKLYIPAGVGEAEVAAVVERHREAIGSSCFGVDCGPIEEVIGALLVARGETVATAESCTGGQISAALTAVPGSSRYFIEGACVYANEAKIRTAGVREETLASFGAVSEQTAREMAEGIRARAGSTYGLATTGIAGPGGATPGKPVGTVHVALAGPDGTTHRALALAGDRERITRLTTGTALDILRRQLQGC